MYSLLFQVPLTAHTYAPNYGYWDQNFMLIVSYDVKT
jgi:hypothetical protein